MSNADGQPRGHGQLFAVTGVVLLAGFIAASGAGSGSRVVVILGGALGLSAVVYSIFSATQRRGVRKIPGTGHVISASPAPSSSTHGRCDLQLVVQAPRLAATSIRHRDPWTPVAKWPTPGASLPVLVDPTDPRHLHICWDDVDTHVDAVRRLAAEFGADPGKPPPRTPDLLDDDAPPPTPRSGPRDPEPAGDTDRDTWITPSEPAPGSNGHREGQLTGSVATAVADAPPRPRLHMPRHARPDTADSSPQPVVATVTTAAPAADEDEPPASDTTAEARTGVPVVTIETQPVDEYEPWHAVYASAIRDVGVTLVVDDLERSLRFYRDALGFFEVDGSRGAALLLVGNGRLLLRQREGARQSSPRLAHVTLDVVDLQATYAALVAKGLEFLHGPRVVLRGESLELWAASFHDPDGHGIALTSWRPRE